MASHDGYASEDFRDEYKHGSMSTVGQNKTFKGFLKIASFLTAFFIVVLLMPILVFAVHLHWLPALIITFIVGVALAWPFRLGGGWFMTLAGLAVLGVITSFLLSLLG